MTRIVQTTAKNQLLTRMSAADFALIAPHLTHVTLAKRQILTEPNQRIDKCWFFEEGYASVIAVSPSGTEVEVGLIGREGVSPIDAILGGKAALFETLIQCEGSAWQMTAAALSDAMSRSQTLHKLLLDYTQTMLLQIAQSALAAASQSLRNRLARWIVMCGDRVDDGVVPVTHEFVSMMLSVRRPGITEAVHELVVAGTITTGRGWIEISDRPALVALAGDGYGAPERLYGELFAALPVAARPLADLSLAVRPLAA